MNAISIILQIGLLLGGAYLWMRYFSMPMRRSRDGSRVTMSMRYGVLSGVGIVMMIVGLSGISRSILALLDIAPSVPGALRGSAPNSGLLLRILLGSLFSGITAGLACLLMRLLLARRER